MLVPAQRLINTARSAAEPAWHRRERAQRGQDRLLLRLWRAKQRLGSHHSAQRMAPRGRSQQSGHNHVLAAIADAIHAHSTYKGSGKGGWDAGQGRELAGRNCNLCGDYNFEHRANCRKCGAALPPPATGKGGLGQPYAFGGKAWGKGGGPGQKGGNGTQNFAAAGGGGGGGGAGNGGKSQEPRQATLAAAAPAGGAATAEDGTEVQDPVERVKEIRAEEERIRKTKAQFTESNPRIVATLDSELAALASERERLQPLEVNLQAAAGRTAHARAHLAKVKEKRDAAAKLLREKMEALKEADKEVDEAESKLRAAEAAATAKRSEGTFARAQDAFEFLQKDVATNCSDTAVAAQLAQAFEGLAKLLAAASAAQPADGGTKTAGDAECDKPAGTAVAGAAAAAPATPQAVPGASASQRRRTGTKGADGSGLASAADASGAAGDDGGPHNGGGSEIYAGGAVDGEITMGQAAGTNKRGSAEVEDSSEELLRQAAAALGEDDL